PSHGFPSVQPASVTVRRRLHMAVFAQQLYVLLDILTAVATGFQVVEVEIHSAAAVFALCSAFCHHLRLEFAPFLVVLGVTEPHLIGKRCLWVLYSGHPVPLQVRVGGVPRPVLGERLVTHAVEVEPLVAVPYPPV